MPIRIETREQRAKRLIKAAKFRPEKAVRFLVGEHPGDIAFMYTWVLAQLLAWMILERRPRKATPKSEVRGTAAETYQLRIRRAEEAGRYALAWLLHRQRRQRPKANDRTLKSMNRVFNRSGGLMGFWRAKGSFDLYQQACEAHRELGYVYRLVEYFCRYQTNLPAGNKSRMGAATYFVAKQMHEGNETYGISEIDKIWSQYKDAAPYIFAFYRFFTNRLTPTSPPTPTQFMRFIERLASDHLRLQRLIGRAAYAADILKGKARNIRSDDFKSVMRVVPPLRRFDADELKIIDSYDSQELTHKDQKDYRPKQIKVAVVSAT